MKNTYCGSDKRLYTVSVYKIIINRVLYPVFLCLIIPLQLVMGQTSWSLSTAGNFNKVTVRNNSDQIITVPVMSPEDQMMVVKSPTINGEKNNILLTGWTQLQTVSGVVKAVSFANSTVGYMGAELGVVYKTTDGGQNWTTVMNLGFPYYWYGIHAFS